MVGAPDGALLGFVDGDGDGRAVVKAFGFFVGDVEGWTLAALVLVKSVGSKVNF